MPKRLNVNGPATETEVVAARKGSQDQSERERLQAIRMAMSGRWTMAEIAEAVGRARSTIGRWIKAFREGGLEGVLRREHGGGRVRRLSEGDLEALKEGLAAGRWKTAKQIQRWLDRERGVKLTGWGVYYWLRQVTGRWKVPRKSHAKKDAKRAEAFQHEIVQRLTALSIPADRQVRVWVQDEHRYGLINVVRRCWTLRGHRPTAPYQTKYQSGYVSGAAEVVSGQVEFLYLPTVSLDGSLIFLHQLVATDPEAIPIVLWDQAVFEVPYDWRMSIWNIVPNLPLQARGREGADRTFH